MRLLPRRPLFCLWNFQNSCPQNFWDTHLLKGICYIVFSIYHNLYNSDDIELNNFGDVFLNLETGVYFKKNKNFSLSTSYSPFGYSKNNYLINSIFYKNSENFTHQIFFDFSKKKPDIFINNYFNYDYLYWGQFRSSNTLKIKYYELW